MEISFFRALFGQATDLFEKPGPVSIIKILAGETLLGLAQSSNDIPAGVLTTALLQAVQDFQALDGLSDFAGQFHH